MYWDLVDVKPQPGFKLFVRFKDGLAGVVQLHPEDLTGALAPLLNPDFFDKVFIDNGAAAWPGEIDLAPDAMYSQIEGGRQMVTQGLPDAPHQETFRSKLARLYQLKDLVAVQEPDAYFQDFERTLREPSAFQTFSAWEDVLDELDPASWEALKQKSVEYVNRKDVKKGRGWQQLFDHLGEAWAYRYLKNSLRCSDLRFIPKEGRKTPDIEGILNGRRILCEVKTINASDDELNARAATPGSRKVIDRLDGGFFNKLHCHIAEAKGKLVKYDGSAEHVVYLEIHPDDWAAHYEGEYLQQIEENLKLQPPGVSVVVHFHLSKSEPLVVTR